MTAGSGTNAWGQGEEPRRTHVNHQVIFKYMY